MEDDRDTMPLKPTGDSARTSYWTAGQGSGLYRGNEIRELPRFFFIPKNVNRDVMNSKESSKTKAEETFKIFSVLSGSGISLFWLVPLSILGAVMIVIGAIYMHSCPAQHFIPIWLVVYGGVTILHLILAIIRTVMAVRPNSHDHGVRICASCIGTGTEVVIGLFLFAWLITGSVWVFKFYILWHSPFCTADLTQAACLCDRVPLLFAFSCIIIIYVTGLISCMVSCCCCCCVFCAATALLESVLDNFKTSDSTAGGGESGTNK